MAAAAATAKPALEELPGGPWTADVRLDKALEGGFVQYTRTAFASTADECDELTILSVELPRFELTAGLRRQPLLAMRADVVVLPLSRHAGSRWFAEPDAVLDMLARSVVPAFEARRRSRCSSAPPRLTVCVLSMTHDVASAAHDASRLGAPQKWDLFQGWAGFFDGIRDLFDDPQGVDVVGHTGARGEGFRFEQGMPRGGYSENSCGDRAVAAQGIAEVLACAGRSIVPRRPSSSTARAALPLAFTVVKAYPRRSALAIRVTAGSLLVGDEIQFQHGQVHWRVDEMWSLCRSHRGITSVVAGTYCTVKLSAARGHRGSAAGFNATFNRLTGRFAHRGSICGSHMGAAYDLRDAAAVQLPVLAVTVTIDERTRAARAFAKALVDGGCETSAWRRVSLVTAEGNQLHATRASLAGRLLPAMRRLLATAAAGDDDPAAAVAAPLAPLKVPLVLEHLDGAAAPLPHRADEGDGAVDGNCCCVALVVTGPHLHDVTAVPSTVDEVWEAGAMLREAIVEFGATGSGDEPPQAHDSRHPRRLTTADICCGVANDQNSADGSSALRSAAAADPAEFEAAVVAELLSRRAPHVLAARCARVVAKKLDFRAAAVAATRDLGLPDDGTDADRRAAYLDRLRARSYGCCNDRLPPRRSATRFDVSARLRGMQALVGAWRSHVVVPAAEAAGCTCGEGEVWAPPPLVLMAHTKALRAGLGAALVIAARIASGLSFGVGSASPAIVAAAWCPPIRGPHAGKGERSAAFAARLAREAMYASLLFDADAARDVDAAVRASKVPLACLVRRRHANAHDMCDLADASAAASPSAAAVQRQRLAQREERLRAAGPDGLLPLRQATGVMYRFAAAVADATLTALVTRRSANAISPHGAPPHFPRVTTHIVPVLDELVAWTAACSAPLMLLPIVDAVECIAGTALATNPSGHQVAAVSGAISVLLVPALQDRTAERRPPPVTESCVHPTPAWLLLSLAAMLARHPAEVLQDVAKKEPRARPHSDRWCSLGMVPRTTETLRELLVKVCAHHARYAMRCMARRGTDDDDGGHAPEGIVRTIALFMMTASVP